MLVIELVGNEVPKVVVTLRRVQRGELGFDEVHREPTRVIRPRFPPEPRSWGMLDGQRAKISLELLQVHVK
jgi:hypothetical protein